jgi:hypothetical protein
MGSLGRQKMKTRRYILTAFPFLATTSALPFVVSAASEQTNSKTIADCLAGVMKRDHGGEWVVSFDKKNEFVIIAKQ